MRCESGRAARGPGGALPCVSDGRAALAVRGAVPQNSPSACAPRGEPGGKAGPPVPWLPLLAPLCACSDQPGTRSSGEPVRTALLGELVQVMTAEADPAAAELKDFFLLIFLQPA